MDNLKDKIKHFLLELFFPSFCLGCQKEGTYLCSDCQSILEISEYNYCLCNRNPLRLPPQGKPSTTFAEKSFSRKDDFTRTNNLINKKILNAKVVLGKLQGKCPRCQDKKLSGLYSALPYKEKFLTRKLIHNFKYEPYIKDLAKILVNILIEHFVLSKNNTEEIWENSILIPIPLEKKKLKSRGYNQAEELAKELSKVLEVPLITDVLIKTTPTLPQMKLSAIQRQENLKNAFSINPVRNKSPEAIADVFSHRISNGVKKPAEIAGKKIFLVDDVYTTGATMEECAKILKKSGAKTVWGIVIAREG